MIIKQRELDPKTNPLRERYKFAWFPTQMKNCAGDKFGEVIWFEKYVVKEHYHHSPDYPNLCEWKLDTIERFSQYVLSKFEQN